MPPPQIFSTTGHPYGLTVSGVQVIDRVPTDVAPIRWTMPSASTNGGISFSVEDTTGSVDLFSGKRRPGRGVFQVGVFQEDVFQTLAPVSSLPAGAVVRLTDNVNGVVLFGGVLVDRIFTRGPGPFRLTACTGIGWGYFLDHRAVDEFTYDGGAGSTNTDWLQSLIGAYGGPIRTLPGYIEQTTTTLDASTAERTTLRDATTTWPDAVALSPPPQQFVDNDGFMHWWQTDSVEAAVVGASTEIGDSSGINPDSIVYEVGSEETAHVAYVYEDVDPFLPLDGLVNETTGNPAVAAWDAGIASTILLGDYTLDSAQTDMEAFHSDIPSVTFSTSQAATFRPHQTLVIEDTWLTNGDRVTYYIQNVDGELGVNNVIYYRVTAGGAARSFVQTVASQ
jgi:hypothetical protein